jgi:hypothetical protein
MLFKTEPGAMECNYAKNAAATMMQYQLSLHNGTEQCLQMAGTTIRIMIPHEQYIVSQFRVASLRGNFGMMIVLSDMNTEVHRGHLTNGAAVKESCD